MQSHYQYLFVTARVEIHLLKAEQTKDFSCSKSFCTACTRLQLMRPLSQLLNFHLHCEQLWWVAV